MAAQKSDNSVKTGETVTVHGVPVRVQSVPDAAPAPARKGRDFLSKRDRSRVSRLGNAALAAAGKRHKLTPEKAREAGIKSGEARRRKREALIEVASRGMAPTPLHDVTATAPKTPRWLRDELRKRKEASHGDEQ